jgi:hypothetical protein
MIKLFLARTSEVPAVLSDLPQTPSLVLVTFRPEYEGARTRVHGAGNCRRCTGCSAEASTRISKKLGLGGVLAPAIPRGGNNLACAVATRISLRILECFHLKTSGGPMKSTIAVSNRLATQRQ